MSLNYDSTANVLNFASMKSAIKNKGSENVQLSDKFANELYIVSSQNTEEDSVPENARPYFSPGQKPDYTQGCFPTDIKNDENNIMTSKYPLSTLPVLTPASQPAEYNPQHSGPVMGPPVDTPSGYSLNNTAPILQSTSVDNLAANIKEKSTQPEGWGVTIKGDPNGFTGWNVKDYKSEPQDNHIELRHLKFNGPTLPPTPVIEPENSSVYQNKDTQQFADRMWSEKQFQASLPYEDENVMAHFMPKHTEPVKQVYDDFILNDGGFTAYIDKDGNVVCGEQTPVSVSDKSFHTPLPYQDDSVAIMHGLYEPDPTLQNSGDVKSLSYTSKDFGYTMPPTPVPHETVSLDGGPVGIPLPYDGGFTVYLDKDGNAVCGIQPNSIQSAIDTFVKEKTDLHPIFSNNPTPATEDSPVFSEITGQFEQKNHSETV